MARAKLTALAVERAQKSGKSVLLSDGDGLYLRKQNCPARGAGGGTIEGIVQGALRRLVSR